MCKAAVMGGSGQDTGASQALMALCGAAVILFSQRHSRSFVMVVIAVQLALDIYTARTIKAGHGFGFATGLSLGIVFTIIQRLRKSSTTPGQDARR